MKKIMFVVAFIIILVVITFSSSYLKLYSPDEISIPIVDIEAHLYGKTITLVHRGGDKLEFDEIKIILTINEKQHIMYNTNFEKLDDNGNEYWEALESISISHNDITYTNFNIKIIDQISNSEIFNGFNQ